MPPTRSARDAQGGVPRRPGGIRPLLCIRPRCLLPGPLVGRLDVQMTARSCDQVPAHPLGQERPKSADVCGFEALRGVLIVSKLDT